MRNKALVAIEKARIALSSDDLATIVIEDLFDGEDFESELTLAELNDIIQEEINQL